MRNLTSWPMPFWLVLLIEHKVLHCYATSAVYRYLVARQLYPSCGFCSANCRCFQVSNPCRAIHSRAFVHHTIGVNFYKADRLEPPPTFQTPSLSGFWAPTFCQMQRLLWSCLPWSTEPNNIMTPNDIHANQTTSFVRIQQWKLQAVSRIVLEFFSTSRFSWRNIIPHYPTFLTYLVDT